MGWRNSDTGPLVFAHELQQMVILDGLNLVREDDEAAVNLVQFAAIQFVTQYGDAQAERVTAGVLSQNQPTVGNAHRLRSHDLVGQRILQDTILMDASFVSECVSSNDGLSWLHRDIGCLGEQL